MRPGNEYAGRRAADGGDYGRDAGADIRAQHDGDSQLRRHDAAGREAHRHADHRRAAVHHRGQHGTCCQSPQCACGGMPEEPAEQFAAFKGGADRLHDRDAPQDQGEAGHREADELQRPRDPAAGFNQPPCLRG